MDNILDVALETQEYVVEIRRRLHEIPELAWNEEKTVHLIKEEILKHIKDLPFKARLIEKTGGLIVDIDIDPSFDRILFRADVDALPIQEETNLPFSSKHPGKMHACGHDMHSAMLLGALKALKEIKPSHNLRLVWQRAEEIITEESGGNRLVKEGVCDGISSAYAIHISSVTEKGVFFSRPQYLMSNADHIKIQLECLGGHVMRPHIGSNAIDIMTDIHLALRGFEKRESSPEQLISFVPAVSNAGIIYNIRPSYGEIWYSFRNFLSDRNKTHFIEGLNKKIECIVQGYPTGKLKSLEYFHGHPALYNDPSYTKFVAMNLEDENLKTRSSELLFSGEDFSYYLQKVPGSFWLLGAKDGQGYDHHTQLFNPSEDVLWKGVAFWLKLAITPIEEEEIEPLLNEASLSSNYFEMATIK